MWKIIEFKDLIEIKNYKENNKVYKVSVLDKSLAKDFNITLTTISNTNCKDAYIAKLRVN